MDRTIDYMPLFAEPNPNEVAAYRRATIAAQPGGSSMQVIQVVGWVLGGIAFLTFGLTFLLPSAGLVAGVLSGEFDVVELLGLIPPLVIIPIIAVLIGRSLFSRRHDWAKRLRMARFAEANGLLFSAMSPPPSYPGAIFSLGSSRKVTDHFRTTDSRYLDFGNYQYTTGSGKNRTTHHWGFLALQLDRALPHMLLDSRANNGLFGSTNLPAVFARDQVLSLEGDFNEHFTLYCPREYERDALYVFTPDLMALLIDEASPFDVEIVDRWMFVYSARPFPLGEPAIYQRLLSIVTTVGAKTLSQTDRYVDERVGEFTANVVAPQGRRLRRGVSWVGIAIIVGFLALWMTGVFSSFR
ncbi:hypothetical protein [Microcella sp.]|uniref:hypothetical protein n=1 Tax=Microcella sp. TaxID=1913979 RepID=UPI00299F71DB|nr:hypothetical protein [Microcella sp.]MDX2025233.1 hypothetical protein [Microcella sp.]